VTGGSVAGGSVAGGSVAGGTAVGGTSVGTAVAGAWVAAGVAVVAGAHAAKIRLPKTSSDKNRNVIFFMFFSYIIAYFFLVRI
jgi:acetyl-CoA carboxylase carboxyltransferase component